MHGLNRVVRVARSCLRSTQGQALIETAIALPLLLLLLLGAAEFARFAYAGIEVSNAANAAADYGASSHSAAADSGGIANAATADAANLTGINALSVTSISTSCACSNSAYTPLSCSDNTTCSSNMTSMVETITIHTQATYNPLIYYPGGPKTIVLGGQATRTVVNK